MLTDSSNGKPTIIRDEAICRAVAQDYGGYVRRVPDGTIQATRSEDVVDAVRYATQHSITLAARGAGHSTHGQSQAEGGLVLDLRGLDRVLDLTPDSILVEAGTLWRTVAQMALTIGRTFPVFTDYLATTVGGTLAVGGVGSRTWQMVAPEPLPELPAEIEAAVYAITLEALTNVAKHAGASRCVVRIHIAADGAWQGGRQLELVICDDGAGLPAEPAWGVGLLSMQARVAEVGGACRIESPSGQGTSVIVRIPCDSTTE